jgi:phospholipid-binding lipoprotein MlaA
MSLPRLLLHIAIAFSGLFASAAQCAENIDPWEPMNRRIFAFNETLDQYILRPTAKGYRAVVPDPAERGISNFIANVYEFNSIFNSLLQGRPGNAFTSAGRFVVNSTVGLAGLIDVATPMGIEHSPTDFDQTLYTWGVESGPFLMLPVFGPRTVRSASGYFVDTYTSLPSFIDDEPYAYLFWTVEAVDIRAQLLKADELVTGDRYIFIRNAYLERRQFILSGEQVEDSFGTDEYEEF